MWRYFLLVSLICVGCETEKPAPKEIDDKPKIDTPVVGDYSAWPDECVQQKKILELEHNVAIVDQTFQENSPAESLSAFSIMWNGVRVPIPDTEYNVARFTYLDGSLAVTLEGVEAVVVLDAPKPTSYDPNQIPGDFGKNPETEKAWTARFGTHPDTYGTLLALNSKLSDLKCDQENAANDILLLNAFQTVGARKELSANVLWTYTKFSTVGFPNGYRRFSPSGKVDFNWEIAMAPESVSEKPFFVKYGVAPGGPLKRIGTFVGNDFDRPERDPPVWLSALETALGKTDAESVKALEQAFKGTGIKTKGSLRSLKRAVSK